MRSEIVNVCVTMTSAGLQDVFTERLNRRFIAAVNHSHALVSKHVFHTCLFFDKQTSSLLGTEFLAVQYFKFTFPLGCVCRLMQRLLIKVRKWNCSFTSVIKVVPYLSHPMN